MEKLSQMKSKIKKKSYIYVYHFRNKVCNHKDWRLQNIFPLPFLKGLLRKHNTVQVVMQEREIKGCDANVRQKDADTKHKVWLVLLKTKSANQLALIGL